MGKSKNGGFQENKACQIFRKMKNTSLFRIKHHEIFYTDRIIQKAVRQIFCVNFFYVIYFYTNTMHRIVNPRFKNEY